MTNPYLIFIIVLIVFDYVLELVVDALNVKHIQPAVPEEFKGVYDGDKYQKAQDYLRETTRFDLISTSLLTPITLAFMLLGGFRWVDTIARSADAGLVVTGLIFTAVLMLCSYVVNLPFSIYSTFVLEKKYEFNTTTPRTFITDAFKGLLLSILIGAPILALILCFFSSVGPWGWLICWLALTCIQVVLMYLAPAVIMPLFNKFEPIKEGELKDAIQAYASSQGFALKGIFTMDGSKRSTKGNAFFTGFGRWRRVVLFDTLVEKQTTEELVSILAHEIGHYKHRHVAKQMVLSTLTSGLMFFLLSLFIAKPALYAAFQVDVTPLDGTLPIYAGLVFFGFLYAPISAVLSILHNILSRKYEYQADAYAVRTYPNKAAFVSALKKLSVDHLSNLVPHPVKVFLEYSHPPVIERIRAIRNV